MCAHVYIWSCMYGTHCVRFKFGDVLMIRQTTKLKSPPNFPAIRYSNTSFSWNHAESHFWNCLAASLPAGQLSFLLWAGTNSLPIPMSLWRWHYCVSSSCPLCNSPNPTIAHILNSCQEALNQGTYMWQHSIVLSIVSKMNYLPLWNSMLASLVGGALNCPL